MLDRRSAPRSGTETKPLSVCTQNGPSRSTRPDGGSVSSGPACASRAAWEWGAAAEDDTVRAEPESTGSPISAAGAAGRGDAAEGTQAAEAVELVEAVGAVESAEEDT